MSALCRGTSSICMKSPNRVKNGRTAYALSASVEPQKADGIAAAQIGRSALRVYEFTP